MSNELDQPEQHTTPEDTTALLNTVKATRSERDAANKRVKELETKLNKYNQIDLAKYEALVQSEAEREERSMLEAKQFGELKTKWQSEKESYIKKISEIESQRQEDYLKTNLEKAFVRNGGRLEVDEDGSSTFDLVYSRARQHISINDGNLEIINRDGTPMLDSKGKAVSLDGLFDKLKNSVATASLFNSPVQGGSGMQSNSSRRSESVKTISKAEFAQASPALQE